MGIESFGIISFTGETKAADFVTHLSQGRVTATKCRKCGARMFPPKMDCPDCLSSDVEWFDISGLGTLETFSVVTYGPSGFENDAPYTLAVADFDGLKMFGRMSKAIPAAELKVGMTVRAVPVTLPENRISYEFVRG